MLTSKQRAYLRSLANTEDAIFQVGGVNENLIAQLNDALKARELIKIKVLETAMLSAREACDMVCEATGAMPVQCIGSRFVIYKRNDESPVINIPRA